MDKVIIKNLKVRGIIGVHDWERDEAQEILINIVIDTDTRGAGEMDDLQQSVNYQAVAENVKVHAETAGRFTVEALAEDIARLCLEEPNVLHVRVRVEKPEAFDFVETVGVEIERGK